MAKEKKKQDRTVLWWILWITTTIASFFVSNAIWTPYIAKHFGSVRDPKIAMIWVAAVFGTWLVILFPLIIAMYQKVDQAYEDARINREKQQNRFRSVEIEKSKRLLKPALALKLEGYPQTIAGGHLVDVTLNDGRYIENVFVAGNEEIVGIYDQKEMPFTSDMISDLKLVNMDEPPFFTSNKWLRLDGVASS